MDIADVLLSYGANPLYVSPPNVFPVTPSTAVATKGQNLVSMAVKSNSVNTMRYVGVLSLEYPALRLSTVFTDFWGETTPLQMAVANGNVEMVKTLLLFKANPNTPYTRERITVGHTLATIYNADMLKLLLANGLDLNYASPRFGTVRDFMIQRGCPDPLTVGK